MMWIRVQLPNRPGSLGRLATALGAAEVDIVSIEVVDRDADTVVNDLMVDRPGRSSAHPADLHAVCRSVPGCVVESIRPYARGGGVDRDLAALRRMALRPAHAVNTLLNAAPLIFRSDWAAIVDTPTGRLQTCTPGVPGQTYFTSLIGDDHRRVFPRPEGPFAAMVEPLTPYASFVVGRRDGPAYFDSEILRLRYLIDATRSSDDTYAPLSVR